MRTLTSLFFAASLLIFAAVTVHAQQVQPVVLAVAEAGEIISSDDAPDGEAELPLHFGLPDLRKPLPSFRYPERALRFRHEGRVVVEFTVNEKGRVKEPRVVKGFFLDCEKEVLRVLRKARFEPILNDAGEPIKARFITGFDFNL